MGEKSQWLEGKAFLRPDPAEPTAQAQPCNVCGGGGYVQTVPGVTEDCPHCNTFPPATQAQPEPLPAGVQFTAIGKVAAAEPAQGECDRSGISDYSVRRQWHEALRPYVHDQLTKQAGDEVVNKIVSALAAARREGMEAAWQPIDTAPKDGTTVLLAAWTDIYGWNVGYGRWESAGSVYGWIADGMKDPPGTLNLANPEWWQPVPAPPIRSAEENGDG